MKRMVRVLVLGALTAGLLGIATSGTASGGSGEVGYTVGFEQVEGGIECDFFSVALATGELTRINDPSQDVVQCADGLTFAPDGTLYAFTNQPLTGYPPAQLVTIDLTTGVQTVIGELPPVILGAAGMTFDGAGNLWLYGSVFDDPECLAACLWQVNPADASTTFVGATSERQVYGLAATCDDVYAITTPIPGGISTNTEVSTVDTTTAALSLVVPADTVFLPEGLDFDFAGGLWSLSRSPDRGLSPMQVNNIDLTTGAATETGITFEGDPFFGFLNGLAISSVSCEEPTPEPIVIAPTFTG